MSKNISLTFVCLLVLILNSCYLLSVKTSVKYEMPLLPPVSSTHIGLVKQKITMTAANKTQTFIVISNDKPQSFEVLVMMATGQTLISMMFDGQAFYEKNMSGLMLPAKEIMAIIQFASWPEEAVSDYYKNEGGWTVQFGTGLRRLNYQQQAFLEVEYQDNGTMIIHNKKSHYQAKIQPLESQE